MIVSLYENKCRFWRGNLDKCASVPLRREISTEDENLRVRGTRRDFEAIVS